MLADQCFTIFEGGGAKGITHLGALRALEDVGLARIGAAGTSAGAIVAALTAVGYKADELFVSGTDNILMKNKATPVTLLGDVDWKAFSKVRSPPDETAVGNALRRLKLKMMMGILSILSPLFPLLVFCLARTTSWPSMLGGAWRIIDDLGFFSTESAREILNELLRVKLGLPERTLVCFRHMGPAQPGCCPLKIIATNLKTAGPALFDDSTPDVVVADAVAASFSIPVFFKPTQVRRVVDNVVQLSDERYVDGGLVSNLPVWAFLEDKRSIERLDTYRNKFPIPVVAFQLADAAAATTQEGSAPLVAFAAYLTGVIRTGVFGGQTIAQKFVTHLTVVSMTSPLNVIQFDCSSAEALDAYQKGLDAAKKELTRIFRTEPTGRRDALAKLVAEAVAKCAPGTHLRASLVRPIGNASFKVVDSIGMDSDADDDLVLDPKNPAAPAAFLSRDFTFVDLAVGGVDLMMTKYERALVRPTLAGIISVPIFESAKEWAVADPTQRGMPVGVFCIDSDTDLKPQFRDPALLRALALGSVSLAPFLTAMKEMR